MQRRTVAIYAAFFLLVGVASYSLVATADAPEVEFENPELELAEGDEFREDGQLYTVTDLSRTEEEGEHGGTTITREATLEWTVEDAPQSETWENGSTISYADGEYEVHVAGENSSEFLLRESIDREAILGDDPAADNETVTRNGTDYVVVEEEGEAQLVPATDYFPEPREEQFATGETLQYANRTVTVDAVEAEGVTVTWTEDETRTTTLSQAEETTIGDTTYLAYFGGDGSNLRLVLTTDFESYEAQLEQIERHEEKVTGLWYVTGLAGVTVVLLFALAFLPTRY
ncbi:MAG: hypothetical protein V5A46_01015 [Haloferacaceae archaeon]